MPIVSKPTGDVRVTAVIPVYGDAPKLGDLLDTLRAQTEPIRVVAAGSTVPENTRRTLADAEVDLTVHDGGSIGADWNAAKALADTPLFFFAHQDDRYRPTYACALADLWNAQPDAVLGWCDYHAIGDGASDVLPMVKRVMAESFTLGRRTLSTPRAKKWVNSLGPVLSCPTAMFRTAALANFRFDPDLRVNLDWDAWYRLAEVDGAFVRTRERLVDIRVHGAAESAAAKADGTRAHEDRELLARYWPATISRLVQRTMETIY